MIEYAILIVMVTFAIGFAWQCQQSRHATDKTRSDHRNVFSKAVGRDQAEVLRFEPAQPVRRWRLGWWSAY